MAIVKLQDGGAAVPFLVQRITDDVSRKPGAKAQYKFSGRTETDADATLWVFSDTAERQFARIGVDRHSVIGMWVEFSKTTAGYIDITRSADHAPVSAALFARGVHVAPYTLKGAPVLLAIDSRGDCIRRVRITSDTHDGVAREWLLGLLDHYDAQSQRPALALHAPSSRTEMSR